MFSICAAITSSTNRIVYMRIFFNFGILPIIYAGFNLWHVTYAWDFSKVRGFFVKCKGRFKVALLFVKKCEIIQN